MEVDAKPPQKRKTRMVLNVLIGLAIVIGLFLIYVALQPDDFTVSRSIAISAPPDVVFSQVNDLRKWDAWSPWEKLDPAMKKTLEEPTEGVGAVYRWEGNSQVGSGSNTITESKPNELIRFKLAMFKPFEGTNDVDFTFEPKGDQTVVTWRMKGKLVFITKIMNVLIGMDSMIGGNFQSGLEQLKSVSEAVAKK